MIEHMDSVSYRRHGDMIRLFREKRGGGSGGLLILERHETPVDVFETIHD